MRFALSSPPVLLALEDDPQPDRFVEVIGERGDQFRDTFTRVCLYLANLSAPVDGADPRTVVVGTTYGNAEAMATLCRLGEKLGRRLSAQYFTNALTSSASAFVNMSLGATGRNMTVSGGQLTPVIALWHLLSALDAAEPTTASLLLCYVYSEEARADVRRAAPGSATRSGVVRAVVTTGDDFSARFDFAPAASAGNGENLADAEEIPVGGLVTVRDRHPDSDAEIVCASNDANGAFAAERFLQRVFDLEGHEEVTLTCATPDGRRAVVTVVRQPSLAVSA